MIAERTVLHGIQYLKQRCRRVAVKIHRDFIHLVEKEYRVLHPRAANSLDNASRHCADIGTAMPANLRLIADAAKRCANEFSPHGARNRSAE